MQLNSFSLYIANRQPTKYVKKNYLNAIFTWSVILKPKPTIYSYFLWGLLVAHLAVYMGSFLPGLCPCEDFCLHTVVNIFYTELFRVNILKVWSPDDFQQT